MAVRRTKNGRWKASNGRTYKQRKSAVRADRRRRVSAASNANRRRKHRRVMRGKRRR